MDAVIKEIEKKLAIIAKEEAEENKNKANEAINMNRTPETAKNFFEKNDENTFNAVFDEIKEIANTNIEEATIEDKTNNNKVKNFENLIKKYA